METKELFTKKQCQYQSPYCQGEAEYQYILKLGKVKIKSGYICDPCKEYLKQKRREKNRNYERY